MDEGHAHIHGIDKVQGTQRLLTVEGLGSAQVSMNIPVGYAFRFMDVGHTRTHGWHLNRLPGLRYISLEKERGMPFLLCVTYPGYSLDRERNKGMPFPLLSRWVTNQSFSACTPRVHTKSLNNPPESIGLHGLGEGNPEV